MCQKGRYTEHGIRGLHGFAAERYRMAAPFVVRVDPGLGEAGVLLEPASVVAKAWDHIDRIGRRAHWEPRRVLVTGAGTIGLLAALLGFACSLAAAPIPLSLAREHTVGSDRALLGLRADRA